MNKYEEFLNKVKEKLLKALIHLDYSYKKILLLPTNPQLLNEETLETWESFSARISRVVDLFLIKYLKAYVNSDDPGFEGTLRDFLNQGEKLKLIDDAKLWLVLRELRNINAHEYTDQDLEGYLNRIKEVAPLLLAIKNKIDK